MTSSRLDTAIEGRIAAGWIAFGAQLAGDDDRTAVDPDALVAVAAARPRIDARVRGVALDWCVRYGTIVNTARLQRIAREIDVDPDRLARFGAEVAAAGGPRWSFSQADAEASSRGKVVVKDLLAPARIAWRVRSGFGVSVKADILTSLLTTPPKPVSVADLAHRSRHPKRSTALAVTSMSLAGIIRTIRRGNQDRVWLDPESPLRDLLEPNSVPDVDWPSRWAVVQSAALVDAQTRTADEMVRLVETRTTVERLLPRLEPGALPYPDLSVTGVRWLHAFEDWLDELSAALELVSA